VLTSMNKSTSKSQSKPIADANGPNGKAPAPNPAQGNGATLTKSESASTAAIVEAMHSRSNGIALLRAMDRNEVVLTLIHMRSFPSLPIYRLPIFRSRFYFLTSSLDDYSDRRMLSSWIDIVRNIVRGDSEHGSCSFILV
jgi:hypothetical protein